MRQIIINYGYNSKITEHLLFAGETRQEQRRRPPLAGQGEAGAGAEERGYYFCFKFTLIAGAPYSSLQK
jgi:hypothetical protein